jgi:hypothetical protein
MLTEIYSMGAKMADFNTPALREDVKTCRLRAADILLVHAKHNLWSWLIRLGTRCYWNHALMVYSPGDTEQDFSRTLIIDAKTSGTVVLGHIGEYLNRADKYDIAVKRFEADWFQEDNSTSGLDFRSHICDTALNEVEIKLGLRFMEVIDKIIRQFIVIFRFIRRKIRRVYVPPNLPWSIRPVQVKAFTCGGFVQWCYFKGVSRRLEERGTDQSRLDEVIFNPRAKKEPTPFELLTSTPADLANCEKLSWKYVIRDGVVREVSSSQEVRLITIPLSPNS